MEDHRIRQLFEEEAMHESRDQASVDDAALMRAIRGGVKRGQASSRRRVYQYGGAGAAGLALATGIFIAAGGGDYLTRAAIVPAPIVEEAPQPTGEWGEYEAFRASASNDPILKSALDKGEVEPLDVTVEGDGYTLQLYGAVRDSRKLSLLYEISGEDVRSTAISLGKLTDPSGKQIGSQEDRQDFFVNGSLYGYARFDLDASAGADLEAFKLEAPVYTRTLNPGYDEGSEQLTVLEAEVKVDPGSSGGFEENLAAGQTLTVAGQVLHVKQALITPKSGYVVLVPDEGNDKSISRLIGAKLTVTKDGETVESAGGLGVGVVETLAEDSSRFIFTFNRTTLPKNPDSVVFSVDGIEALGREEQQLIVNTETAKLLQAPDEKMTVNVNPGAEGTEVVQFGYPIDASKYFEGNDPPSTMFLWNTFTDADGVKHPLEIFGGGSLTNQIFPNSKSTTSTYQYASGDYPQPLTFKIVSYPKEVSEYAEIRLK